MRKIIAISIIALVISCGPSRKEKLDRWYEQQTAYNKELIGLQSGKMDALRIEDSASMAEAARKYDAEIQAVQSQIDSLQKLIDGAK